MTFSLYRKASDDFGTKDWAVKAEADKVVVCFGKTDKNLQTREIPKAKCVSLDTSSEASIRINKKIAEGYEYVGEANIQGKKAVLKTNQPNMTLFWSSTLAKKSLLSFFQKASDLAIKFDNESKNITVHVDNMNEVIYFSKDDEEIFSFGLSNIITFHRIDINSGKGQGKSSDSFREEQVIFLKALAKNESNFHLADSKGNTIDSSIKSCPLLPSVMSDDLNLLAQSLDLLPTQISWDKIQQSKSASQKWFY